MTKIVNLDQLETKRDKVVVLGGVEHVMKTLTVKDYVHQLKTQAELEKLSTSEDIDIATADRIMELTIKALHDLFPSLTIDQLEALNMEQLNAIRDLAQNYTADEAPKAEDTGESTGKA
jgi:hypothetical protein